MTPENLKALLSSVRRGRLSVADAAKRLAHMPFEDLGFAKVDHHRALRTGMPEVILCMRKTPSEVALIAERIVRHGHNLLGTKASSEHAEAVRKALPDARFNERAGTISIERKPLKKARGRIAIVTAGTSDIPVAEEARETCEILGNRVDAIHDAGVAGIHRLFGRLEKIRAANVVIVVAGMEGALASVVGGLVSRPVIAVPTSVGYGAAFEGLAPLLTMLNSCAAGIAVVNIDNGFGAAVFASLVNRSGMRP